MNFRTLDLYAVVGIFSVNFVHNLIESYFLRFRYFLFLSLLCIYNCCCWANQNCLTLSLKKLGLNWGLLVRILFVLFIYALKIPLLLFLHLKFSQQQELNIKVVDSFQYLCSRIEVWNLPSKFQNQFIGFFTIV